MSLLSSSRLAFRSGARWFRLWGISLKSLRSITKWITDIGERSHDDHQPIHVDRLIVFVNFNDFVDNIEMRIPVVALRLLRGEGIARDERATVLYRATSSDSSALAKIVQDRICDIGCRWLNHVMLAQEVFREVFDTHFLRESTNSCDITRERFRRLVLIRIHFVENLSRDFAHVLHRVRDWNAATHFLQKTLRGDQSLRFVNRDRAIVVNSGCVCALTDVVENARESEAYRVEERSQDDIVVKIRETIDREIVVLVAHCVALLKV